MENACLLSFAWPSSYSQARAALTCLNLTTNCWTVYGIPAAPASLALWQYTSTEHRSMGLKYWNMIIGARIFDAICETSCSTCKAAKPG